MALEAPGKIVEEDMVTVGMAAAMSTAWIGIQALSSKLSADTAAIMEAAMAVRLIITET